MENQNDVKTVQQLVEEAKAAGIAVVEEDPTQVPAQTAPVETAATASPSPAPVEVKAAQVPETKATEVQTTETQAEPAKVKGIDGKPLPKLSAKKLAEYEALVNAHHSAVEKGDTAAAEATLAKAKHILAYGRWYVRWRKGETDAGATKGPAAKPTKVKAKSKAKVKAPKGKAPYGFKADGTPKQKPGRKPKDFAPYGLKADGTPRQKPGRKPGGGAKVVHGKGQVPGVKYGQNGPTIKITVAELNEKERATLLEIANLPDEGMPPKRIDEIATNAFKDLPLDQGRVAVKNSLRRLVRGKLVLKAGRGLFRPSPVALEQIIGQSAAKVEPAPAQATVAQA